MRAAAQIAVEPDDLAAIVDSSGRGVNSAGKGDIERGEHAVEVEESMSSRASGTLRGVVLIDPHDLATIVDAEDCGRPGIGSGHIEGREVASGIEKPMLSVQIPIVPHDLADIIDAAG